MQSNAPLARGIKNSNWGQSGAPLAKLITGRTGEKYNQQKFNKDAMAAQKDIGVAQGANTASDLAGGKKIQAPAAPAQQAAAAPKKQVSQGAIDTVNNLTGAKKPAQNMTMEDPSKAMSVGKPATFENKAAPKISFSNINLLNSSIIFLYKGWLETNSSSPDIIESIFESNSVFSITS